MCVCVCVPTAPSSEQQERDCAEGKEPQCQHAKERNNMPCVCLSAVNQKDTFTFWASDQGSSSVTKFKTPGYNLMEGRQQSHTDALCATNLVEIGNARAGVMFRLVQHEQEASQCRFSYESTEVLYATSRMVLNRVNTFTSSQSSCTHRSPKCAFFIQTQKGRKEESWFYPLVRIQSTIKSNGFYPKLFQILPPSFIGNPWVVLWTSCRR